METLTSPENKAELAPLQKPSELLPALTASTVPVEKQNTLIQALSDFIVKSREWNTTIESLVITSPDEIGKMKMAKEGRLTLKNMRLQGKKIVEAKREEIKRRMAEDIDEDKLWLKSWQIVESIYSGLEEKLQEKENFAVKWEEERRKKLKEDREKELTPYSAFVPFGIDLSTMSEEDYQKVLSGAKLQHDAKIEADRKAEELKKKERVLSDRNFVLAKYSQFYPEGFPITIDTTEEEYQLLLKEAAHKKSEYDEEQERIRVQNEELKKKAEEAQKKLQEQEEARKKPEAENAANLKKIQNAQAEQDRLKKEAEDKQKLIEQKEQENKKLSNEINSIKVSGPPVYEGKPNALSIDEVGQYTEPYSDKEILSAFVTKLKSFVVPDVKSKQAKVITADFQSSLNELIKKIESKIDELKSK